MPKLILLRGNSGSGKTTTARRLQETFGSNTMLISHDMIRRDMLHTAGQEGVRRSLPLMTALLQYGHQHSEITILEGILSTKHYQELFETAASLFGDEIYAYYYDLPFEETVRRHRTRPSRDEFGEEELRSWWLEKDFLPMIAETILTQADQPDETVERIYRDVMDARRDTCHGAAKSL